MRGIPGRYTREYFNDHYETLMRLYSVLYTDLELSEKNTTELELTKIAAKITVESHLHFNNCPYSNIIKAYVESDTYIYCSIFKQELTTLICFESALNQLEKEGCIIISRNEKGQTSITLTEKGIEKSINIDKYT